MNARVMDRDEHKEEGEKLKLEICKKCLSSELLERRILGIKELNVIIRNTTMVMVSISTLLMICQCPSLHVQDIWNQLDADT